MIFINFFFIVFLNIYIYIYIYIEDFVDFEYIIIYHDKREEEKKRPKTILLKNARIFNGVDEKLSELSHVLIVNNIIKQIISDNNNISISTKEKCTEIDLEGRTLLPGLIDMQNEDLLAKNHGNSS